MTPLEQLEQMRERELQRWGMLRTEPPENDVTLGLISFAIAVLEMPEKAPCYVAECENKYEAGEMSGYNTCLAKVKAIIEGKVG